MDRMNRMMKREVHATGIGLVEERINAFGLGQKTYANPKCNRGNRPSHVHRWRLMERLAWRNTNTGVDAQSKAGILTVGILSEEDRLAPRRR
jgi:hypothetical protein